MERRRRTTITTATAGCAALLGAGLLAPPAHAGWQFSAGTLIDIRTACRDGIRLAGAVRGEQVATTDYATYAVAAQPPPEVWSTAPAPVVRAPIVVRRLASVGAVVVESAGAQPQSVPVSHLGEFTVPTLTGRTLTPGAPVAVTITREIEQSSVNTLPVADCHLFAPIDITPGRKSNPVPIGRGTVTVALLGTATLRVDKAQASRFRFGPRGAAPQRAQVRDVNKDRRPDLVLSFAARATGLTCRSKSATLTGRAYGGGSVEGRARVAPVGCP